jgi:hypothetical protein
MFSGSCSTMTSFISNIELQTANPVESLALATLSKSALEENNSPTAGITENLMPYEAAAKAIFVKANGLPAYYKATGTIGFT